MAVFTQWLWLLLACSAVSWAVASVVRGWLYYSHSTAGLRFWLCVRRGASWAFAGALVGLLLFEAVPAIYEGTHWSWFPKYAPLLLKGLGITLGLLIVSVVLGFALAIPIGLVQVTGPKWLAWCAKAYCTVTRGTPLLVQLWLLYYGIGSLLPLVPGLRGNAIFRMIDQPMNYAILAFTLSFAAYEGEVMRGGFLSVPRGELEAAHAFGMTRRQVFRRIWLPRAFRVVLPTLGGEIISQLKSIPLAATITVLDLYGVADLVRANTALTFEPLIVVGIAYGVLVFAMSMGIRALEGRSTQRA